MADETTPEQIQPGDDDSDTNGGPGITPPPKRSAQPPQSGNGNGAGTNGGPGITPPPKKN